MNRADSRDETLSHQSHKRRTGGAGSFYDDRSPFRAQGDALKDSHQSAKGTKDEEIAKHLDVSVRTVERVRKRCTLEGITAALNPKKRPPRDPKLDGDGEARLVQIACSSPPEGRQKWTLHLLADKLVLCQPYPDGCRFWFPPFIKGG